MLVLGIESSCDETGAALISDKDGLLADALYSQIDMPVSYTHLTLPTICSV